MKCADPTEKCVYPKESAAGTDQHVQVRRLKKVKMERNETVPSVSSNSVDATAVCSDRHPQIPQIPQIPRVPCANSENADSHKIAHLVSKVDGLIRMAMSKAKNKSRRLVDYSSSES